MSKREESQIQHVRVATSDRPKREPLLSSELDPFDPATQEDRAFLDLFRSVNVGEMIAVVGSGVTVPYGYMSWSSFCAGLIEHLQQAEEKGWLEEAGRALFKQFRSDTDKVSKLNSEEQRAICGAMQAHLNKKGKEALESKYREWFGRKKRLKIAASDLHRFFPNTQKRNHPLCLKSGQHLPPDLGRLVELCVKVTGGTMAGRCWSEPKSAQELIRASRNIIDPLTTLRSAVRISRFATLNYDLEIESMLEDYDYPYNTLTEPNLANPGTSTQVLNKQSMHQSRNSDSKRDTAVRSSDSRTGSSARSISISVENASELIGVAAGSRSEDAVVVHLHGAATKPEDMVVTPGDYNALYIHEYPEHASFDDARMLMFGGNAILYVGVGLSEEDLMRPLRYLASALPDRPIYALMPSMNSRAKDRAFVHNVKASYGVNAIIYGRAHDDIPALWAPGKVKHALGDKFNALHEELENVRKALTAIFTDPSVEFEKAINSAMMPRLCYHPEFNEILKCMHFSIKGRVEERRRRYNSHIERHYIEIVTSVSMTIDDSPISDCSIAGDGKKILLAQSLHDEKQAITDAIAIHGHDAYALHRSLTKEIAPRLHHLPAYKAVRKLLDSPADEIDANEQELIKYVENLVTSIALDQILSYLPESAAQAQRRWEIAATPSTSTRSMKSASSLIALNAAPLEDVIVMDDYLALERATTSALKRILKKRQQNAFVIQLPHGTSRADFLDQAIRMRKPRPGSRATAYDIRTYRINNLVDANMVLPGILYALGGNDKALAIIYDALHLLDPEMRQTKNLSIEHHLSNLVANGVRLLLLTHSRGAAQALSKRPGIELIDFTPPTPSHAIAPGIKKVFDEDADGSWALQALIPRYIWPNKALTAVIDTLPCMTADNNGFLAACNRLLESRLRASDRQFSIPIFCDVLLQTRHIWVRRYGTDTERRRLVIEHAILKWMFAIHFPIGIGTIQRLVEIQDIKRSYELGCIERCGHSCTKCAEFNIYLNDALSDLERCGFILPVENRHDVERRESEQRHERRYIVDSNVYRYLAHTRGLTHDAADRLEWSISTLCNAVFCRGPLLSENDYRSTRDQFKSFVEDYYCEYTLPDADGELPSEPTRHENYTLLNGLNCAFALLRGHLHAHNAIRAGIAYYKDSDREPVLDAHIGRLSELRSTTLSVPSGHIPYQEYFEVWVVNEIAVAKYIKGDFHDAVMMLRQILFALRTVNGFGSDPTIKPRIKINLCMCLIERAKFKDALSLLDEAEDELSDIACAKSHPEGKLLTALIHGCRAQIQLLTARLEDAEESIRNALELATSKDALGARGWLHGIASMIAQASRRLDDAKSHQSQALAAARGSLRPDLIISLEIAETELAMRDAAGEAAVALATLACLKEIEKTAHQLGSQKARVSILLMRARILLQLEQVDSARALVLDAISLSMLNGMRLKRISGLVLMAAIMAMRGEHKAARSLLETVKLKATQMRYIRAVLDIDRLHRAMEIEGGVSKWASYLSESDVSPLHTPHT